MLFPESCAGVRKGAGEALAGARASWVLSREREEQLRDADAVWSSGRQHREHRHRKVLPDPARSEAPHAPGSSLHGSREIPRLPVVGATTGRSGKPTGGSR
jgi:hypothetical protein